MTTLMTMKYALRTIADVRRWVMKTAWQIIRNAAEQAGDKPGCYSKSVAIEEAWAMLNAEVEAPENGAVVYMMQRECKDGAEWEQALEPVTAGDVYDFDDIVDMALALGYHTMRNSTLTGITAAAPKTEYKAMVYDRNDEGKTRLWHTYHHNDTELASLIIRYRGGEFDEKRLKAAHDELYKQHAHWLRVVIDTRLSEAETEKEIEDAYKPLMDVLTNLIEEGMMPKKTYPVHHYIVQQQQERIRAMREELRKSHDADWISECIKLGAKRWTKGGHDRLYIDGMIYEVCDFKVSRYGTGNISSATLHGEDISNANAGRLTNMSAYIDLKTGKMYSQYVTRQICEECLGEIMAKIAELKGGDAQ